MDLDAADPEWIKPESLVSAVISINRIEGAVFIPNQAIFSDQSGDWVQVPKTGGLVRQDVQLGLRGPNRSQVVAGLEPGDQVALVPPVVNEQKETGP